MKKQVDLATLPKRRARANDVNGLNAIRHRTRVYCGFLST